MLTELVSDGAGDSRTLVMTNLDAMAMPLIRYAIGDFAAWCTDGSCACGCRFRKLGRLKGRLVDALQLAAGRTVSPFYLMMAVRDVSGVRRYQIIQEGIDVFRLRLEARDGARRRAGAPRRARDRG